MRKGIDCKGREWEEIELYGKMIDATNLRFGELIALFPVICNGKRQWLCKCTCGNELVAAYNILNNGNTKSCGCYHKQIMKDRWSNYREENNCIGQRFGRLTTVKFLRVENESAIYLFHCDCGNDVELPLSMVKSGNTSSCGCLWKEWNDYTKGDIIGLRFSKLVVRSYVGIDKHGNTLFECDCDCGNTTLLPRDSLVRNKTHSCGCIASVGESNIKKILNNANIKYKHQQTFDDLVSDSGKELLYDFGILDDNNNVLRLIEFDGLQHYKPIKYFGGDDRFLKQQKNDYLKNQYARSHNIPLVRIPYSKRDTMTLNDLFGSEYLVAGDKENGEAFYQNRVSI